MGHIMSTDQPVPAGLLHLHHKTWEGLSPHAILLLWCDLVVSDNSTETISHTVSCGMSLWAAVGPDWTQGLTRVWHQSSNQEVDTLRKPKTAWIVNRKPSDLLCAMWERLDLFCRFTQFPSQNHWNFFTQNKVLKLSTTKSTYRHGSAPPAAAAPARRPTKSWGPSPWRRWDWRKKKKYKTNQDETPTTEKVMRGNGAEVENSSLARSLSLLLVQKVQISSLQSDGEAEQGGREEEEEVGGRVTWLERKIIFKKKEGGKITRGLWVTNLEYQDDKLIIRTWRL